MDLVTGYQVLHDHLTLRDRFIPLRALVERIRQGGGINIFHLLLLKKWQAEACLTPQRESISEARSPHRRCC